jgi:hypothetical protein
MPTPTYDSILSFTLGSATTTVTIGSGGNGSIPSTYTDLVLVIDGFLNGGTGSCFMKFNSSSGSEYSYQRILTTGTAWANGNGTLTTAGILFSDLSSSKFAVTVNIFDYANTSTNKTILSHQYQDYMGQYVGRWNSQSVINSITLIGHQNFTVGTTFNLYGIKAGS